MASALGVTSVSNKLRRARRSASARGPRRRRHVRAIGRRGILGCRRCRCGRRNRRRSRRGLKPRYTPPPRRPRRSDWGRAPTYARPAPCGSDPYGRGGPPVQPGGRSHRLAPGGLRPSRRFARRCLRGGARVPDSSGAVPAATSALVLRRAGLATLALPPGRHTDGRWPGAIFLRAARALPRLARGRGLLARTPGFALGFLQALAGTFEFFLGDTNALLGDIRLQPRPLERLNGSVLFACCLLHV
jgi:hypothetical protein